MDLVGDESPLFTSQYVHSESVDKSCCKYSNKLFDKVMLLLSQLLIN